MRILYLPNSYSQQRQREKKANIYPVLLAMQAQWYRQQGHEVFWKEIPENKLVDGMLMDFDKVIQQPESLTFSMLPHPDRVWSKAKDYTSGNYKYLPGTHILSATGCWWGKCSFCVEYTGGIINPYQTNGYEVRPVEDVISEIEECKALGFKEVFDDSASFPIGEWGNKFCEKVSKVDIRFSCNMRITNYLTNEFCRRLRKSGFRMLLFGIESANQKTLDKINKGVKSEDIIPTIKRASDAGLEPHIAVMFGYPWETDNDAVATLKLVHYLLRKGYAKTAQASLYCPKDGPRNEAHKKYVKKIYDVGFDPRFWLTKLRDINDINDLKYIWRGIKSWYQS